MSSSHLLAEDNVKTSDCQDEGRSENLKIIKFPDGGGTMDRQSKALMQIHRVTATVLRLAFAPRPQQEHGESLRVTAKDGFLRVPPIFIYRSTTMKQNNGGTVRTRSGRPGPEAAFDFVSFECNDNNEPFQNQRGFSVPVDKAIARHAVTITGVILGQYLMINKAVKTLYTPDCYPFNSLTYRCFLRRQKVTHKRSDGTFERYITPEKEMWSDTKTKTSWVDTVSFPIFVTCEIA